jgi:hypothetical protein
MKAKTLSEQMLQLNKCIHLVNTLRNYGMNCNTEEDRLLLKRDALLKEMKREQQ